MSARTRTGIGVGGIERGAGGQLAVQEPSSSAASGDSRGDVLGGEAGGETIDDLANLIQLGDAVRVQRDDAQTLAAGFLDEALAFQQMQGVADGLAGDAEAVGEFRLADALAGRQAAVGDCLAAVGGRRGRSGFGWLRGLGAWNSEFQNC